MLRTDQMHRDARSVHRANASAAGEWKQRGDDRWASSLINEVRTRYLPTDASNLSVLADRPY